MESGAESKESPGNTKPAGKDEEENYNNIAGYTEHSGASCMWCLYVKQDWTNYDASANTARIVKKPDGKFLDKKYFTRGCITCMPKRFLMRFSS